MKNGAALERGVLPESAYMDLLDYKKTWNAQWEVFRPMLDKHGQDVSSHHRALEFDERLLPVRLKVAHPTKTAATARHVPSQSEQAVIASCAQLIIKMYRQELGLNADGQ